MREKAIEELEMPIEMMPLNLGVKKDPWLKVLEGRVEELQKKHDAYKRNISKTIERFRAWVAEADEVDIFYDIEREAKRINDARSTYKSVWLDLKKAESELAEYKDAIGYEDIELNKPEAFYTGGGIWLCGMHISDTDYYIIDNDFPCISRYDDAWNEGMEYPAISMVGSWNADDLDKDSDIYKAYVMMRAELDNAIC